MKSSTNNIQTNEAIISTNDREVVSLGDRNVVQAAWDLLIDRGYRSAGVSSCPIDDYVAVRYDDEWHLWRSDEPDLLVNALGCKDGLVDPTVAWVQRAAALNADGTTLVVAFADLEGRCFWRPTHVDIVTVEVAGELVDFDVDHPVSDGQWDQLRSLLAVELAHSVERGERLDVSPIQWDHGDHPMVMSFAEPGDYVERGEGFYVEVWPETGDDDPGDGMPIAPYRRSSLSHVVDAMCAVIKSWGVSPLNLTMSAAPYLRGIFSIPE